MAEKKLRPGWRGVKFGDVVRLVKERCPNPKEKGVDRYVGLEHIDPNDLKIRRWGNVADGTTFTNSFREGQVLFGKRRAYQRKVAVADFSGVCSGDIYVLESAKPTELLPPLLPFICQTDSFFKHAVGTSAGSLSPRTNWTSLSRFEFALPPLRKQERMAELLYGIESNKEAFLQAEQKAIRVFRSVLDSSFSYKKQDSVLLSALCGKGGIQIGPFGAQLHQSDYVDGGVPVVMPKDMVDDAVCLDSIAQITIEKAKELSSHRVRAGDILLPRRGELNRRAWISSKADGFLCGTGSIRIRPKSTVNSRAIFYSLSSPATVRWLEANSVGTTMKNLNSTIVAAIPVQLPPEEMVQKVVRSLDQLQSQIVAIGQRRKRLREISSSVLRDNV